MGIKYLMDVHVNVAITAGLRLRGIDVLTAQEDGSDKLSDPDLLDRATCLGRVLFSYDADLLREANRRQRVGIEFAGVIYEHQRDIVIGKAVDDLHLVAQAYKNAEMHNKVEYLPL